MVIPNDLGTINPFTKKKTILCFHAVIERNYFFGQNLQKKRQFKRTKTFQLMIPTSHLKVKKIFAVN